MTIPKSTTHTQTQKDAIQKFQNIRTQSLLKQKVAIGNPKERLEKDQHIAKNFKTQNSRNLGTELGKTDSLPKERELSPDERIQQLRDEAASVVLEVNPNTIPTIQRRSSF